MVRRQSFRPVALSLALLAALLRLAPHPPNFAPVGGLALFSGARLSGWQAYLVPLFAMAITDPILSHRAGYAAFSWATPIIYLSLLITVSLGRILLSRTNNALFVAAVATLGSVQFFALTNFFVWLGVGSPYPHTMAGLAACYVAAIPFFGRSLLADLFYSGVLFAGYSVLSSRLEQERVRG